MAEFMSNDEMIKLNEMLQEICEVESSLYHHEINFIDRLTNEWEGNFTVSQANWLRKIYKRVVES